MEVLNETLGDGVICHCVVTLAHLLALSTVLTPTPPDPPTGKVSITMFVYSVYFLSSSAQN